MKISQKSKSRLQVRGTRCRELHKDRVQGSCALEHSQVDRFAGIDATRLYEAPAVHSVACTARKYSHVARTF